jgi:urease accessory protein
MPENLHLLLSDHRFPAGDPEYPGGADAACSIGLVSDMVTLKAFLLGRLRTVGAVYAFAAAAVCARAGTQAGDSFWRAVEAELDARIASPAARRESRMLGGDLLRRAQRIGRASILDGLARSAAAYSSRPHHAAALGAVGAIAAARPAEAAAAAAHASLSGPALAAQLALGLDSADVAEMYGELNPEIGQWAEQAERLADRPLSSLPAFSAPALDYLIEAGSDARRAGAARSLAS